MHAIFDDIFNLNVLNIYLFGWSLIYCFMFLGHGWGAADEGHEGDSPVSFEGGDHGSYSLSGSEDYSSGHE